MTLIYYINIINVVIFKMSQNFLKFKFSNDYEKLKSFFLTSYNLIFYISRIFYFLKFKVLFYNSILN